MIIASPRYLFWFGIVFSVLGCSVEQSDLGPQSSTQDSISVHAYTDSIKDTSENSTSTSDRINAIQNRLVPTETGQIDTVYTPKYKLDVSPYNKFLNDEGYLELLGRSMMEIDSVLGESPIMVRQSVSEAPIRKEIRVYLPYQEDTTGLYIYFENESVIQFKMDEFNGILQSGILDFLK